MITVLNISAIELENFVESSDGVREAVFSFVIKTMKGDINTKLYTPATDDGYLEVSANGYSYSFGQMFPTFSSPLDSVQKGEPLSGEIRNHVISQLSYYDKEIYYMLLGYNRYLGVNYYGTERHERRETSESRESDIEQKKDGSELYGHYVYFNGFVLVRPEYDGLNRIVSADFVYSEKGLVDSSEFYDILKEYNNNISAGFDFTQGQFNEEYKGQIFEYLESVYKKPLYFQTQSGEIYVNLVQIWSDGRRKKYGFDTVKEASEKVGQNLTGSPNYTFRYDYVLDSEGKILTDNTKPSQLGFEDFIYLSKK